MSLRFTLARMMCTLAFTSTLACTILSQTTAVTVGSTVRAMDEAVPAGWTILDSCSGDLNQDLLVDLVLVIQAVDSAMSIIDMDTVLAQPRSIVVLFGSDMGGFSVFAKNDRFIPLHFDSIEVATFGIKHREREALHAVQELEEYGQLVDRVLVLWISAYGWPTPPYRS